MCPSRKQKGDDPSKYEAVRYMRHERHEKCWKQKRGDAVTSQCPSDLYKELESTYADNLYFYSCVSVYVQEGRTGAEDNWKAFFLSPWVDKRTLDVPANRTL